MIRQTGHGFDHKKVKSRSRSWSRSKSRSRSPPASRAGYQHRMRSPIRRSSSTRNAPSPNSSPDVKQRLSNVDHSDLYEKNEASVSLNEKSTNNTLEGSTYSQSLTEEELIVTRRIKRVELMQKLAANNMGQSTSDQKLERQAQLQVTPNSELAELANPHSVEGKSAVDYDENKNNSRELLQLDNNEEENNEEEDDMFAFSDVESTKEDEEPKKQIKKGQKLDKSMLDKWDDAEGYYRIISGELIDERYQVTATLGKGMFAAVVRALDNRTNSLVAIKIIRNNETMEKSGLKEMGILLRLNEADPQNNRGVVRLLRHFYHKNHLCLVFENLNSNLRDVLKKFGRNIGINIKAIQSYTQQTLAGLALLRECNIIHADLKPDNILVSDTHSILKVADLGSASDISENEITPYLVSRFYRAPELILGLNYDYAIDMWSLGCSLFELYVGKILFPGNSNNHMLKLIMESRGKFSHKMLRKGQFAFQHFDNQLDFQSLEIDKITERQVMKTIKNVGPTLESTIKARLEGLEGSNLTDYNVKLLDQFIDLLDKMLVLTPEKRITPVEALKHPFINSITR